MSKLSRRTSNPKIDLKEWNSKHFVHCSRRIEELEARLIGIQSNNPRNSNLVMARVFATELEEQRIRKECLWKQKSRELRVDSRR